MQYTVRYQQLHPTGAARGKERERMVPRSKGVPRAALILACAALVVSATTLLMPDTRPTPQGWSSVPVSENDTLWAIASRYPVGDLDVASTVDLIEARNSLTSGTVHPGQVILVPTAAAPDLAVAMR